MNTEHHTITVSGLQVEIVRKNIKNLHLGVYPPSGRVRVAVPLRVTNEAARLAVVGKLGWIRRQQSGFEKQVRESAREMVTGESHYFLGHRYRLHVIAAEDSKPVVVIRNKARIELHVRPGSDLETRQRVLADWYRAQLKELLIPLMDRWQKRLGVEATACGIKKMKTKWGTCNVDARRVWINLELAKKSPDCLEYVVAHELVHLLARHHDDRFMAIMDEHLPRWRGVRKELNWLPLAHETWRE
jgi:predicted metal-dependent hydrolase